MTAEPDLLPLLGSVADWLRRFGAANGSIQSEVIEGWFRDYARANVAHATAAKDAEIEALRAEVEMLRDAFSDEDMTAGAHWFGRYVEQKRRAEQLAEEVEALRAEVGELHMHAKRRDQYAVEKAAQALDWKKRAERLAEALRKWWAAHRPVGWTEDQHRACPYVNLPTDTDKALAEALLRDQEEGRG